MKALVGYTGFVGQNLCESTKFDALYRSTNIKEAFGTRPDLLVYSGVPSAMFLANKDPQADFDVIKAAMENIKKINPKKLVLISTIAVYQNADRVDERSVMETQNLSAYGKNRLLLEQWVEENYDDALIVRLPAIYGKNLKKNFIYDYIHVIPALLNKSKYEELKAIDDALVDYYALQENGFYRCVAETKEEECFLKDYFGRVGFSALHFTDSRSVYQFYHLKYLWGHIEEALKADIHKLNLAVEPLSAAEVYAYLTGKEFVNELSGKPFYYDFRTRQDALLGGTNGYLFDKKQVLLDLGSFVREQSE